MSSARGNATKVKRAMPISLFMSIRHYKKLPLLAASSISGQTSDVAS
jgi:hypothetical protein